MNERAITYQPRAPHPLYTPCVMREWGHVEEIEPIAVSGQKPMTFRELLDAIINLIKEYMKGRKNDR